MVSCVFKYKHNYNESTQLRIFQQLLPSTVSSLIASSVFDPEVSIVAMISGFTNFYYTMIKRACISKCVAKQQRYSAT